MKHLSTFILCFLTAGLWGQVPGKPIFCGNEVFSDILREHYPELQETLNTTFEHARQASYRSNDPLTIPVVVHVVWNNSSENLHDSIILNQIQVLNEDYNRLNADSTGLRSIFQNEAGRGNIHFQLVEIIRVHTDQLFNVDLLGTNLLGEVKHSEDGGSDAWDTESYLNIWITKIQPIELFGIPIGQILGFAFPPNGLSNWPAGVSAPTADEDGVVLDYRIIGRNNPNEIEIPNGTTDLLTVKGRSATHEVGHYLGLRHIWGDGGLLGPNDCLQSDGIDDTPFASAQSAFDCDKLKNSCSQVESHYNQNMPDLIENFMDYAADDCMNMFTHGQVELMRNVLLGPRNGLLSQVAATREVSLIPDFTLSPNPASDVVRLDFEITEQTEITIRISDIGGHLTLAHIKQQYFPGSHQISINVSGFTPGMYFIELRTKVSVAVKKLVRT